MKGGFIMNEKRDKLLKELMAADFTVIELNLYLDTHPYEQNVIALRNNMVQRAKMLREQFEREYGPLTSQFGYSGCPWQWIESPWPWERQ